MAGSNKAVPQGRGLETLSAKSCYRTQARRQRHSNHNITVKVEGVFIWTTSRGLTVKNSGLPLILGGGGMPAHISEWIAAQRWEGCIYPWASTSDILTRLLTSRDIHPYCCRNILQRAGSWLDWWITMWCNHYYSSGAPVSSPHCGIISHTPSTEGRLHRADMQ